MQKLELQWKKGINAPYEVKNLAINGAFDFWQELVGATRTINTATTQFAYSSDMFKYYSAGATSASTDSNGVTGLTIRLCCKSYIWNRHNI